jgi:hypothetical protein
MEAGRRLDEICAAVLGGAAHLGQDLLVPRGQQDRRLHDHLEHRRRYCGTHRRDVRLHSGELAGKRGADVDDHVDLVRAGADGLGGFLGLDRGQVLAGGKPSHRRHSQAAGGGLRRGRHHRRRDAHRVDIQCCGFSHQGNHVRRGCLGFEQGVVDQRRHLAAGRVVRH